MKNKRIKDEKSKIMHLNILKNKKVILIIILLSIAILSIFAINSKNVLNEIFNQEKKKQYIYYLM